MAIQQNTDRIRTTHIRSLPRPHAMLDLMKAKLNGQPYDQNVCYGINEGPRLYEASLADIIAYVFKINAGSYSFEAANPRHEHEYHVFERSRFRKAECCAQV